MLAPKYYSKFHCIADRCRHNCCIDWEIDIDEATLRRYRALPGRIGDEIRAAIREEGERACFSLRPDGRCALLDERGLCRVISALGEGQLCEICREHPRFYHTVNGRWECGLGASCEEAVRLILEETDYVTLVHPDGSPSAITPKTGADFDADAWRKNVYAILSDATLPLEERKRLLAAQYGFSLKMVREELVALLDSLEYLEKDHHTLFRCAAAAEESYAVAEKESERFLAYLIYRHASPTESEREFRLAVELALLLERLFCALIGHGALSPAESARILSLELEYSEENTEAILFALELKAL